MSSKRTSKQPSWGRYLAWEPFQREVAALLLVALGAITLLGLLSITRGALTDGWGQMLRQMFGLGAYGVVLMCLAAGFFLLRPDLTRKWAIGWEKVLGLEVFFLAGLGLFHLGVPGEDPVSLARAGSGGGYVGWAISNLLAEILGYELCAVVLFLVAVWGLALTSPATASGLRDQVRVLIPRVQEALQRRVTRPARANSPRPRGGAASSSAATKSPVKGGKAVPPVEVPLQSVPVSAAPVKEKKESKATAAATESVLKARQEGKLPDLDILDRASSRAFEEGEVRRKAKVIEETLEGFGLPVKVVEINRGPAVTQYGVEPGLIERKVKNGETTYSRVRVSKISSLVNDLALALAAAPIRIEAPVPGRSVVGIEVPNDEIAVVSLRSIMESQAFTKMKSRLKIALGQDVSGQPVVADLAAMPHLLIAGATGSGKSVCINAIVTSLLFNNTPEQMRVLLIDPKRVELTAYNGIPHLLAPVIIEIEQVVGALTWVTRLMEERYRLFSEHRARNIEDYNSKMGRKSGSETLPYIVVVIDELADLMMAAPTEVEWAICRIAQMARATGIHLVLATQRPSVDVVTGLIKANFPARISFAVTSQVDSRVVIDTVGAEALLGRGDMLYMAPDAPRLCRIQGCFVSDKEINRLVAFWHTVSAPTGQGSDGRYPWSDLVTRDERDELLDQAVELVRQNGRASASFLQRRLRIGYPRAARLMDQLEAEGIVGPPEEGGRYRQVSDVEMDRWDAELEKELEADFTRQQSQN